MDQGALAAAMSVRGRIRLAFPSPGEATQAEAALRPDNGGLLRSSVEAATLVLEAESATVMGLLRSLDDAMACLRAAGVP